MASILNNFFSGVFSEEDLDHMPVKQRETEKELETVCIDTKKIAQKIKKLRGDSAAGPDNINPGMLKELGQELAEPLSRIFYRSLNEGEVPEDWKTANVTPIYKKGAKSDPGNYRPVSLTSVPCRILESLIKDELMKHLTDNKLIKDSQHGFMQGKSCSTNLVEFLEKVTKTVDGGKPVDVFYLDFAKAFDKVPRERLLLKLHAKGVSGRLLNWIRIWLTNRTQQVKIGGQSSEKCEVKSGVPQGTVLGPPLFTVFIDDLDDYAVLIELLIKFADDTKGFKEINGLEDRKSLQETLDNLYEWARIWGMSFNVKKCKIMHIGHKNPNYEYFMNGEKFMEVEEERDIGVLVHKSLKPTRHCKKAAATAGAVLKTISRNFHYRDRNIFLRLYKQYVRPHLEFASPAWSPWLSSDINMIEKIQERALNMVSGLESREYKERCREVGLDSLQTRRERQDILQTYKIMQGIDKVRPEILFTRVGERQEARTRLSADPLNLKTQLSNLDIRKHSFAVRVVENWNKLDKEVKNIKTVGMFKNAI